MSLLDVDGIDVFYGPIQALRGVSLRVEEGEKVALVGANGAGKTTTLRAISGLLAPTAGTIRLGGAKIDGLPAFEVVKHGIAHLPEGRELFSSLPVVENLKLGYWAKRKEKAGLQRQLDRVMDHFPRLRERATQAAGTLSGGEQQMLGVARALMSSPKLLIVDELSLGLAPIVVAQLFDILEEVNREGTSVLLVEQFVHLALQHTARAYVLQKGEVVMAGSSADLVADPTLVASYLGETGAPAAPGEESAASVPAAAGAGAAGGGPGGGAKGRGRASGLRGRGRAAGSTSGSRPPSSGRH
ncbi:MAG: ABC transporter ATP-binding protein [Acidobacteria bacterium]|nr:ABC transporter ATP-binding protein [Acidobacteriota bacterium]